MKSMLLGAMVAFFVGPALACSHTQSGPWLDAVRIERTRLIVTEREHGSVVSVVGVVVNPTDCRLRGLQIEAQLTDANGKVIDVLGHLLPGLLLPAGKELSFKLHGEPTAALSQYVGVTAKLVSADTVPDTTDEAKADPVKGFLYAWGPYAVIIATFAYALRRIVGRGSPQARLAEAMAEQNALLTRHMAALEALTASMQPPTPPESVRGETAPPARGG